MHKIKWSNFFSYILKESNDILEKFKGDKILNFSNYYMLKEIVQNINHFHSSSPEQISLPYYLPSLLNREEGSNRGRDGWMASLTQ